MANKLPRRTMSMAKRAQGTAKAAADLDIVEDAIGSEEENAERFSTSQLALGCVGAILGIVVVLFAAAFLFGSPGSDHSMLPDGYREATGLAPAYQGNGRSALPSVQRSPFPNAQQEVPIILEVTCPDGTVHIATGERVADTLCVRGVLVEDATTPTPDTPDTPETVQIIVVPPASPTPTLRVSTVGGTNVPDDLHCQEDEGIAFDGVPDTLYCVHVEPDETPDSTATAAPPVSLPNTGGQ